MSLSEEIEEKLKQMLTEFLDEYDFVIGIMTTVKHTDDRKAVIQYMENSDSLTPEDIVIYALKLDDERKLNG